MEGRLVAGVGKWRRRGGKNHLVLGFRLGRRGMNSGGGGLAGLGCLTGVKPFLLIRVWAGLYFGPK